MRTKRNNRKWNARLMQLLTIAFVVAVLSHVSHGLTARWIPQIHKMELLAYDLHCQSLPRLKPDPRIVLVGMDDASLNLLNRTSYPLPRSMHGTLVDALHDAGAKVIGFDVWFAHAVPEEDRLFAEAIRRHGKIVAALLCDTHTVNGEEKMSFAAPAPLLRPHILAGSLLVQRTFGNKVRWFLPYPADGDTGARYPQLAVLLAAAYYDEAEQSPAIRDTFRLGHIDSPIGEEGEVIIRYGGPAGTFPYVPYADVYTGRWKRKHPADFFKNKIVLVGRISDQEDRQLTPLGDMQGAEILLNATQTLLQHNWIRHLDETVNFLVKLGLCWLFALAVWRFGIWGALLCASIEAIGLTIVSNRLFVHTGLWLDTVEPISALGFTVALTAFAESGHVRRTFYRFLPSQEADRAIRGSGLTAGTAEREATIVFADIRQFTALSESLPSDVTEALLHAFYSEGERLTNERKGVLDKFVGDEIIVRFEDHKDGEGHALRAVRWAFGMQAFARRQNDSGVTGAIGFRVGIGICTGVVRVGFVGAADRLQATAIGDAVNVASRLQHATKELHRPVLIGSATFQCVTAEQEAQMEAEQIDAISVKGKQEPQTVYFPRRITLANGVTEACLAWGETA